MNNTNPMFGGSNTTSSAAPSLYTGLTNFRVLDVNPTKEQIEGYLGKEYKLNVNYDRLEFGGKMVRPYEVWLEHVDGLVEPSSVRFYLGESDDINQNGTIRFVNAKGVTTQAKSEELVKDNPKQEWFWKDAFRVAKQGEFALYTFMQQLMRYNNRDEGAAFLTDAENAGITPASLYDGEGLTALRAFFQWCNENGNTITAIAAVRKTIKESPEGSKTYYNQMVINNSNFFYRSNGDVSSYAITNLQKAVDERSTRINNLFTVAFQAFKEAECVNNVPEETASVATGLNMSSLLN